MSFLLHGDVKMRAGDYTTRPVFYLKNLGKPIILNNIQLTGMYDRSVRGKICLYKNPEFTKDGTKGIQTHINFGISDRLEIDFQLGGTKLKGKTIYSLSCYQFESPEIKKDIYLPKNASIGVGYYSYFSENCMYSVNIEVEYE